MNELGVVSFIVGTFVVLGVVFYAFWNMGLLV